MNREKAKELLPIIEAFANGEDIEYRVDADKECGSNEWTPVPCTGISLQSHVEYRIKPKPREFWISTMQKGHKTLYEVTPGDPSIIMTPGDPSKCDMIKVREVIE